METVFRMALKKYKVVKTPICGYLIKIDTIWGKKTQEKM